MLHLGEETFRYDGLRPTPTTSSTASRVRTLARPAGELLCRFATVNDVHFGETECGRIDDHPNGPILRPEPGEPPYPELMNGGAVREIAGIDPDGGDRQG